ncbi:MAG TPA: hypothetical protein VNA19_11875 [Pyrinomonadaceae bacterium]|jgi:hypothetical protein|nr:hypothetical protein [Pyrinomonadaceae bacterium]
MKIRVYTSSALCIVLCLFACAAAARANVPDPSRVRPKVRAVEPVQRAGASRMVIEASGDANSEVRLQIPREMLKQLRAQAGTQDETNAATTSGGFNLPPAQTVLAGLFLSLSFITGGFLMLRSRRRSTAQRAAFALVACVLGGAALATVSHANIGPPRLPPLDAGTLVQAAPNGTALKGSVRVEVVSEGNEIKLIIPQTATETDK